MNQQSGSAIRVPRSDDQPLWDIVFACYGRPAVLLAHRLGLFRFLAAKPATLAEICAELGIASRPAEAILAVNASLGFVEYHDGRFALTALSEDYLLPGSPTYFGGYFDLIIDNYSVCSIEKLEKAARTDSPQVYEGNELFRAHEEQANLARYFTRAMHSMSMAAALAWPSKFDLSGYRQMLDVGGGSGAHAIGATLRWPNLRATVFDLDGVCEVAREMVSAQGLDERIGVHAGDMWSDPFPAADIHFYSNIFHDWPPEKCRFLCEKSFKSLESGGLILVHEVLYNDDKTGPFPAAAYSMIMLGWTTGRQYSGRELSEMLVGAGFRDVGIKPTFGFMSVVSARKP